MKNSSFARRTPALLAAVSITFASTYALQAPALAAPVTATAAQCSVTSEPTIEGATLKWNIKDSFKRYIKSPIARGKWTVDGVSDGEVFTWENGSGTFDSATKSGEIAFPGSIHFEGHEGKLDLTFSNVRLVIKDGKGSLVVDSNSREFVDTETMGEMLKYQNITLATVDLSKLNTSDESVAVENAPASLTKAGVPAFGGFYEAGQELSALSFNAKIQPGKKTNPCTTSAEVTAASKAKGLTVTVKGSDYANLPASSSGKPASGFYIAVVDASVADSAIGRNNTLAIQYVNKVKPEFEQQLTVPTDKLSKDSEIKVVVWTAHGAVTDSTRLFSEPVSISEQQREALFPSSAAEDTPEDDPTDAPTDEPTEKPSEDEPTAEPSEDEPTTEPSSDPSKEPTSTPTNDPAPSTGGSTPAKEKQTSASSSVRKINSASMQWAVRDSFRNYIRGPIAHGSWELSGIGDTAGAFTWSKAQGTYDSASKTGEIAFDGSIHFTGHKGILDLTFTHVRIQIKNGKGYLVVDADSREFVDTTTMGEMRQYRNIVLGTVDLSHAQLSGDVISVKNAPVTLAASGVEAFGGFYQAGEELAPLSFTAKLGEVVAENKTTTIDTANTSQPHAKTPPATSGSGSVSGADTGTEHSSSTSGDSATTHVAAPQPATHTASACVATQVQVPVTEVETTSSNTAQGSVHSGKLSWGLKTSFRNYIQGGIAQGGWTLSGASYSNGAFNFANGKGTFNGKSGRIKFRGSMNFTGHKGILNTTISNLELEINGKRGILWATVSSNDMSGKKTNFGKVQFASVNLSSLKVTDGGLSVSGAAVNLTATGAKAFAGFYNPGQALDPLSFSAQRSGTTSKAAKSSETKMTTVTKYVGEDCPTNANADSVLARTGASGVGAMTALGLTSIVLGISAMAALRRRALKH